MVFEFLRRAFVRLCEAIRGGDDDNPSEEEKSSENDCERLYEVTFGEVKFGGARRTSEECEDSDW